MTYRTGDSPNVEHYEAPGLQLKNAWRGWTGHEHQIGCCLCDWSETGDDVTELEDAYKAHSCSA